MKKLLTTLLIFTAPLFLHAQTLSFNGIDINPGKSHSSPSAIVIANGNMFFAATTATHGRELWMSDGTATGTKEVLDIYADTTSSNPQTLVEYNNKVYFFAKDNTHGYELWVSDGTATGTQLVKDINQGSGDGKGCAFSPKMIVFNGKLLLEANDGVNGCELWISDGTTAGTQLLKDINPGINKSDIEEMTIASGKLYFTANDGLHGKELWATDGTTTGTQIVKDINIGGAAFPSYLMAVNGKLCFIANDGTYGWELWVSDGSLTGTVMVKDINPGPNQGGYNVLATAGNTIYLLADDGQHGKELWTSDGTAAGTNMLIDINPTGGASIENLLPFNGKLYFDAYDGSTHGSEPWISDGTAAGTRMLKDIVPGYYPSEPQKFYSYKNNVYFIAFTNSFAMYQLYITDGTEAGTILVSPVSPPQQSALGIATGNGFITYNSSMYFTAWFDDKGVELWSVTDNSPFPNTITKQNTNQPAITLYPNPAHHNFTIKTTTVFKTGSVTLTDVTGRVVKTEKLYNNEQTISLQGIAPGIYIADVWLDDKRSTQKLVVE
ncbi:MAG: ELWxxDGT repeat protein [Flavipsychrobacter sp.]